MSMEGEKIRRLASAATSFVDEGKLDEAHKLIDQQAGNSTSEALLNVRKKLADAEQSERDRITNWQAESQRLAI